jgi:predicted hydrocarbon binding protein
MSNKKPNYFYPNKMGRIILLAMEEILGMNGIDTVLNHTGLQHWINNYPNNNLELAFPFEDLSHIQTGMEEIYGPRAGQSLALRIGQATFKYGLREFGPMLGISNLGFRLLPLRTKLSKGADIFADTFNKYTDQKVRVTNNEDTIYWHIERCPICWQRNSAYPCCNLAVGILQEALYWISGGRFFQAQETECIARGDPTCKIEIKKRSG